MIDEYVREFQIDFKA